MPDNDSYREIVRRFADPNGEFYKLFSNTMRKYRATLTEESIRDLFQDSFLAARKNLVEGRIRENTCWNSYLISIGLNLASHEFRKFGKFDSLDSVGSPIDSDATDQSRNPVLATTDEETEPYNSVEVQNILAEKLGFMNENCRRILELTLYDRLSSEEIANELGSTPRSIITRRNRCKKNLITLVREALIKLGYDLQ